MQISNVYSNQNFGFKKATISAKPQGNNMSDSISNISSNGVINSAGALALRNNMVNFTGKHNKYNYSFPKVITPQKITEMIKPFKTDLTDASPEVKALENRIFDSIIETDKLESRKPIDDEYSIRALYKKSGKDYIHGSYGSPEMRNHKDESRYDYFYMYRGTGTDLTLEYWDDTDTPKRCKTWYSQDGKYCSLEKNFDIDGNPTGYKRVVINNDGRNKHDYYDIEGKLILSEYRWD